MTGTLLTLPGANPVQSDCYEEYFESTVPALLSPVYVDNGTSPTPPVTGTIAVPAHNVSVSQKARGTCVVGNNAKGMWQVHPFLPFLVVVAMLAVV